METEERIKISCPVCSEEHSYTLKVTRSGAMGIIPIPPQKRNITRLFTCPTKNQEFQATLSFWTREGEVIASVEVEKLAK